MGKRPVLNIEGNKKDNFKLWKTRFNSHCLTEGYRDIAKDPSKPEEHDGHYKNDKRIIEIAELKQCLPDKTLKTLTETIEPSLSIHDLKKPWVYMKKLEKLFLGTTTTMANRYIYWNHLKQTPDTSMSDWEVTVMENIKNCNYKNNEDEFMRDKFVFDLADSYSELRQEIFWKEQQLKEDEILSFDQVVAHAKGFEAAKKATKLMETPSKTTEEQVNWTKDADPGCNYCGGPRRHPMRQCKAATSECDFCHRIGHFAKVCFQKQRKPNDGQFDRYNNDRGRGYTRGRASGRGRGQRGFMRGTQSHRGQYNQPINQIQDLAYPQDNYGPMENQMPYHNQQNTSFPYEDQWEPEETFHTERENAMGKRFFANLELSSTGNNFDTIKCQIDTAATCNTMPENLLRGLRTPPALMKSNTRLIPYGGPPIQPLGRVQLLCHRQAKYQILEFQVVPSTQFQNKPALISGIDSRRLGLIDIHADEVHAINTTSANLPCLTKMSKEDIIAATPHLWEGTGTMGPPVDFTLDECITPRHAPHHRLPVAKKDKVCHEIARLVKAGRLVKVNNPTEWESNMQVREKPNKIRLCIDPSQTLNLAIKRPTYQMPTLDENLHKLKRAKCYSILDVQEAYQNIPLTTRSSYLTTMNTPMGRYRWTHMPFGISSAAEEFQKRIHEALEGIEGIINIADDILVFGSGEDKCSAEHDHDQNLRSLLQRCAERNIKLNSRKFQFKVKELKFMGHIISEDGLRADPEKVECITNMPKPTSKAATRRFLGMLTYLSKFCPALSHEAKPLRDISNDQDDFTWGPSQDSAFDKCKLLISQAPTLQYFDTTKPVYLQVDASEDGIGCSLLQPTDGNLKPVAYHSCAMTKTERNYAQIEKETLAICAAFAKWDQYLYGHPNITVHTDHQPLETIFKKPLNAAPRRLQKMRMKLQRYTFSVHYKPGSLLYLADTLSRASLQRPHGAMITGFEVFRLDIENTKAINPRITNATSLEIQQATLNDNTCRDVMTLIQSGWPRTKDELPQHLQMFWQFRDELSTDNNMIFKANQTYIPGILRSKMLKRLHSNHYGPDSTLRMARDLIFWQGMPAAIRDMCNNCETCAKFPCITPREPMLSYPTPELPWQIVSQDLFQWEGNNYLITVDHYSDFFEMDHLVDTRAETVIKATKQHYARHGIPQVCITDNGPQFICSAFQEFAARWRFIHVTSSPYHSQANGKAESAVKIGKGMLKKSDDLHLALLNYRNTPQQGHSYSPSQRLMGRRTRTTIPTSQSLLTPFTPPQNMVMEEIQMKRDKSKIQYDKGARQAQSDLRIGEFAFARPPPNRRGGPWSSGHIVAIPAPRSYVLETPQGPMRRNRQHIQPHSVPRQYDRGEIPMSPRIPLEVPQGHVSPNPRDGMQNTPTRPPNNNPTPRPVSGRTMAQPAPGPQVKADATPPPPVAPYVTRSGRIVKQKIMFDM